MTYRVQKAFHQYSLVDLLEILQNPDHAEYAKAKEEVQKRNPTKREQELAVKGLEIRRQARMKPLSAVDKLYCVLLPMFRNTRDVTEAFERDLDQYQMYGENRRYEEMKKWQLYGRLSYMALTGLLLLFYLAAAIIRGLK